MRKRRLSAKEKEALTGKISHILGAKGSIVFAYIFGSFASGEDFNDIDVGIFVSAMHDRSPLSVEVGVESALEDAVRVPADVRIVNHAPLSFVYHVLKSGIVIVDNNKSLRADFEGLICKKYFDFQYLRKEYLREIIHAPV